jgi:hypothetical protein
MIIVTGGDSGSAGLSYRLGLGMCSPNSRSR